jgi:hypothetical protein
MNDPIEELPKSEVPDRTPIQFSIRTLLELTAIMCIVLSLWLWGGETCSRAPEFFLGLAGVLLTYGVVFRRGVGIIGVFVVLFGVSLGFEARSDRRELDASSPWRDKQIKMHVVDSETGTPIRVAAIRASADKSILRQAGDYSTLQDRNALILVKLRYYDMPGGGHAMTTSCCREICLQVDAEGYKSFRGTLFNWMKGEKLWILLGDEPVIMELSK